MNPYLQLALTLPVYCIGLIYFGKSAYKSVLNGTPNMNVLITLGSTAAMLYSLFGLILGKATEYMFFETAATTITLVFLGNYLEELAVERTQVAIKKLIVSQKIMANMIAFDDQHQEQIFVVESNTLRTGDLVLIKAGEQVPADCKVLAGEASINEAIITGESLPVEKKMNDLLIGGSILENGTIKAVVTAAGADTVLSHIIKMISEAQAEKPPVQQMADRISAVFVPVVVSIAIITVIINYFFLQHTFNESLLRSIAVLVIACPCAMGLATPAAIAVGLGRATRNGILFKNARSLEVFKNIKQVVFDKTGTLTTGKFKITAFNSILPEDEFKQIAFSLEKYSLHPLAKAVAAEWKFKNFMRWNTIAEVKGEGMRATDKEGNTYQSGSYKIAQQLTQDLSHNIYILKNGELIGWVDLADEIRPEAKNVINHLKAIGIKTILLSGDKKEKCLAVAKLLGIDEVLAEQKPDDKLAAIAAYNAVAPTAMVGDGINDGPALAKATVGISLSNASQVAMQSAQVVLMNNGLQNLSTALILGKKTYATIKENLFWAIAYNVLAIPVAMFGFLTPTVGALVMGLSDVVLAINSIRLNFKKVS
jgi:Cu+-exporting ATPase